MRVTLDTNVIYQALRSSQGASFQILQLVREGGIRVSLSHSALLEYEAVLTRPKSLKTFGLGRFDVLKVIRFIAYVAEKFEPRFLFRPNLIDEDDNMFIELAVVSQSTYLVTQNVRHYRFGELRFDSYSAVTPAEFLKKWREDNG